MNVQDVADRVRRIFGDDASVQILDADLFRWINDAQLKICTDNEELLETVVTTDVIQSQADYSTPGDMNVLRSLMHNNFRLRGLSFAQFNEYLDGFKATQSQGGYGIGTPEVYMLYGGLITLFPTPNKTITNGLRIYYARYPSSVGTLADGLGVPDRYHNSIVQYVLKQAYEMDENLWMVEMKDQEFSTEIQKIKDQEKKSTTEYYPTITTLPEDDLYLDSGGFYG